MILQKGKRPPLLTRVILINCAFFFGGGGKLSHRPPPFFNGIVLHLYASKSVESWCDWYTWLSWTIFWPIWYPQRSWKNFHERLFDSGPWENDYFWCFWWFHKQFYLPRREIRMRILHQGGKNRTSFPPPDAEFSSESHDVMTFTEGKLRYLRGRSMPFVFSYDL